MSANAPQSPPLQGLVFNTQRFCLHDGPGVRTVLFLKGCSLRCAWCCNPESQSSLPEVLFDAGRCIQCGKCVESCPHGAILAPPAPGRIDRERCRVTGACAEVCPTGALRLAGKRMTVDEAVAELLRDRNYYDVSGGGVTLSGGEPLLQPEFTAALLAELKNRGVHTAVETAGCVPWDSFEASRAATDLYLFDIKHTNDASHRAGTGQPNGLIHANLRRLAATGARIILRYVLLPGYNMDPPALDGLGELARGLGLDGVQLLTFHRLGAGKYGELGRESAWRDTVPPDAKAAEGLRDRLAALVDCEVALG